MSNDIDIGDGQPVDGFFIQGALQLNGQTMTIFLPITEQAAKKIAIAQIEYSMTHPAKGQAEPLPTPLTHMNIEGNWYATKAVDKIIHDSNGAKIPAIKELRQLTSCSLLTAKNTIEARAAAIHYNWDSP